VGRAGSACAPPTAKGSRFGGTAGALRFSTRADMRPARCAKPRPGCLSPRRGFAANAALGGAPLQGVGSDPLRPVLAQLMPVTPLETRPRRSGAQAFSSVVLWRDANLAFRLSAQTAVIQEDKGRRAWRTPSLLGLRLATESGPRNGRKQRQILGDFDRCPSERPGTSRHERLDAFRRNALFAEPFEEPSSGLEPETPPYHGWVALRDQA
jgi:hypothetical protein